MSKQTNATPTESLRLSKDSASGFNLRKVAIALNLSIEKLMVGWRLEFSGSLLVLHWRFVKVLGIPGDE